MTEIMIEVSDLSRNFGSICALDRINLQVKRGEVMGFLGPNGAGKTTAMRILAGLLAPTSGSVQVAGLDVLEQGVAARAKIGLLPETPPLYGEMTVREYLSYLAALRRVPRTQVRTAVERAMSRCGLESVSERLLRNLSKGYRQRAGIAQAIVHSPEVVILDEPTVGLDPIQIREIRGLIRELGGEHSVLLSTHILPEVRMTCNRVALISQGRIVADDTLEGLEKRAQSAGLLFIRLNNSPEVSTLAALPGVAHIESGEGGGWWITPHPQIDPTPAILRNAVEKGWDLRELSPASHSLEDIFVQLTTQEADPEAHAAGEMKP
ncbi:MAG: ABC transporter ATP-binding protein [Magnetococcus sp. DMHC-6]